MKTQKMTYKCDNTKGEPVFQLKLDDGRLVDVVRKAPNYYVRPIPAKPGRNIGKKVNIIEVENRGFRLRAIAWATILTLLLVLFLFGGLKNISNLMKVEKVHGEYINATEKNNLENRKPVSRWKLNSNGYSQRYFELTGENKDQRAIQLLQNYGMGQGEWQAIKTISRIHKVYPEVLVCIGYADTSLGKFLKTKFNIGNVGNNDRGNKVSFDNFEQGVNAIGSVLNNRYLGKKKTINELSPYEGGESPYYATSPENREINVLNCLGMINNKEVSNNFSFRR